MGWGSGPIPIEPGSATGAASRSGRQIVKDLGGPQGNVEQRFSGMDPNFTGSKSSPLIHAPLGTTPVGKGPVPSLLEDIERLLDFIRDMEEKIISALEALQFLDGGLLKLHACAPISPNQLQKINC